LAVLFNAAIEVASTISRLILKSYYQPKLQLRSAELR